MRSPSPSRSVADSLLGSYSKKFLLDSQHSASSPEPVSTPTSGLQNSPRRETKGSHNVSRDEKLTSSSASVNSMSSVNSLRNGLPPKSGTTNYPKQEATKPVIPKEEVTKPVIPKEEVTRPVIPKDEVARLASAMKEESSKPLIAKEGATTAKELRPATEPYVAKKSSKLTKKKKVPTATQR